MTDDLPPPSETLPARLVEYLRTVAADSDRDGRFPAGHIAQLREHGLLRHDPDTSSSGLRARIGTVMALAELCPSTAFVVHMHHSVQRFITALTRSESPAWFATTVASPDEPLFCSANSEPGMHYKRPAVRSTMLQSDPRGGGTVRLRGRKHFCSAIGLADYVFSLATDGYTGRSVAVVYPRDAPGVNIVGEWDSLGLRATDSRSLELDVTLSGDFVLPVTEPLPTEYWSLGYAAISHGIGRSVVRDIVALQDKLVQSGRWGESELHELGRVAHAERAAAALLGVALERFNSATCGPAVVSARVAANEHATSACAFGLETIGGEAAHFGSPWSQRLRDAATIALLPPSAGRQWRLLGLSVLGKDLPLVETSGARPPKPNGALN